MKWFKYSVFALCIAALVGICVNVAKPQSFGLVHYTGPNMPCNCDSLVGQVWDNSSQADCQLDAGSSNVYWLADRYSVMGTGASGAHIAPLVTRNPNMVYSTYYTFTDERYDSGTPWKAFVDSAAASQVEKTYLHWSEETTLGMENPLGYCYGVRVPANSRISAYWAPSFVTSPPTGAPIDSAWSACATTVVGSPCYGTSPCKFPVYALSQFSSQPIRFLRCFGDSAGTDHRWVRGLTKQYIAKYMNTPASGRVGGTGAWFTGLFFDNTGPALYNWAASGVAGSAVPVSSNYLGGHVREYVSGGVLTSDISNSVNVWNRTARDSLIVGIMDTFNLADGWHNNAKDLKLNLNLGAAGWLASLVAPAHRYFLEWGLTLASYNTDDPINQYNWNASRPAHWTTPRKNCATTGTAPPCTGAGNYELPWGLHLIGHYAFYKLIHSGDETWGVQWTTAQCDTTMFKSNKRWSEITWGQGLIDSTLTSGKTAYMGTPTGAPTLHYAGSGSNPPRVYKRYFNGSGSGNNVLVLVRVKGPGSMDSLASKITISLPNPPANRYWRPIKVDGKVEGIQFGTNATFEMPAGRGKIFVHRNFDASKPCGGTCEEIEP